MKGGNGRASSLGALLAKDPDISRAYKLGNGNVGESKDGLVTLPLYMAMFM